MKKSYTRFSIAVLIVASLAPNLWSADSKSRGGGGKTRPTVGPPKWKKDVLDTFFTDASSQLSGERPNFGAPRAAPGAPAGNGNVAAPAAGGADGFKWSELISADTLEATIKSNTTLLGDLVKEPGVFKASGNANARKVFSETAVLFGVIARYDGDVRWKDKAAGMREGTARAGFNCKVGTEASFKESRDRQRDMAELIRGGNFTLPEPGDQVEWKTAADRPQLMKRMEQAGQEHLKQWTSNKGEFNSHKDKIIQEAQILAALSQVIMDKSFDFAEDGQYRDFAKALQQGCLDAVAGAKMDDFDKAAAGVVAINKSCSDCHGNFR